MPVGYKLIGYVSPVRLVALEGGRTHSIMVSYRPDIFYTQAVYVLDEQAPAPADPIKRGPTDRFSAQDAEAQAHVEHDYSFV